MSFYTINDATVLNQGDNKITIDRNGRRIVSLDSNGLSKFPYKPISILLGVTHGGFRTRTLTGRLYRLGAVRILQIDGLTAATADAGALGVSLTPFLDASDVLGCTAPVSTTINTQNGTHNGAGNACLIFTGPTAGTLFIQPIICTSVYAAGPPIAVTTTQAVGDFAGDATNYFGSFSLVWGTADPDSAVPAWDAHP